MSINPASIILIVVTLVIVVFDVFFATDLKAGNTFSETILWYAVRHPVIPFALGVLCGHLTWPQYLAGVIK